MLSTRRSRVLVPVDAQPLETFEDVLGEFGLERLVGVLDAKQEAALVMSGKS